jgi:hypothetical protein
MNDNCGKVYFQVPKDIAPGNYLVRAEVIALHVAGSVGGAQFYMSCYQLTVAGSGSASPATVRFPGAYSATDPGILINIHTTLSGYTIPGPAVYEGGAAPGTTAKTTAPGTTASPTTASPTTVKTTASPSPTGSAVAHYGQCGGNGYAGSTNCASPYTCVAVSPPYVPFLALMRRMMLTGRLVGTTTSASRQPPRQGEPSRCHLGLDCFVRMTFTNDASCCTFRRRNLMLSSVVTNPLGKLATRCLFCCPFRRRKRML